MRRWLVRDGLVVTSTADTLGIEFAKEFSCRYCADGRGCGLGSLFGLVENQATRQLELPIAADPYAAAGDRVRVGVDEVRLARLAAQSYAWPLMGLIIGALPGALYADGSGDWLAVAGATAGLALAVLMARRGRAGRDTVAGVALRVARERISPSS